eukprot:1486233-Amphidinium_carterae.3
MDAACWNELSLELSNPKKFGALCVYTHMYMDQPSWAGLEGFELEAPAMSLVMEESALSGQTCPQRLPPQHSNTS